MVCFPNAKINLGLNITSKRQDGFHNIETVFYPIPLSDILEFNQTEGETSIKTSGVELNIPDRDNICYKAYCLLSENYDLPTLEILLHKIIPFGAGLGGGSADAAFLLKELNNQFTLNIPPSQLEALAAKLGSDCAFFIKNQAVFAHGRGEIFENIQLDLSNYYIYLIKPDVFVGTAEAYAGVTRKPPKYSLKELIKTPIKEWKNAIYNDFEESIFSNHPKLAEIKQQLYQQGAVYASMSGSGSSLFGIFAEKPTENKKFDNYFTWISKL